jgi:hypothetical protein
MRPLCNVAGLLGGVPLLYGRRLCFNLNHYVVVSEGASPNFMFHELVKYTFFWDSEPTAEVQNVWTTCTGSG